VEHTAPIFRVEEYAKQETTKQVLLAACLLLVRFRRWREYIPLKQWRSSTKLHGITAQKAVRFIVNFRFDKQYFIQIQSSSM
jgi:hypothetical protein